MKENQEKKPNDKEAKKAEERALIVNDQKGAMIPKTMDDNYRLACYYAQSQLLPASIDTPEKALVAMDFISNLGLTRAALRQVYIVNNVPNIWGDLPLAVVEKSGLLESIEEKILDEEYEVICLENKNLLAKPYFGVCKVKRQNGREVEEFYSIKDADIAGYFKKTYTLWDKQARRMLQLRARSLALKNLFPDVLQGIAIAEFDNDVDPKQGNIEIQEEETKSVERGDVNLGAEFLETPSEEDIEDVEFTEVNDFELYSKQITECKEFEKFEKICKEVSAIEGFSEDEAKTLNELLNQKHKELKNAGTETKEESGEEKGGEESNKETSEKAGDKKDNKEKRPKSKTNRKNASKRKTKQ